MKDHGARSQVAPLVVLVAILNVPFDALAEECPCCSDNTWPVTDCFDWVTGPASSDANSPMTHYEDTEVDPPVEAEAPLWATDVGIPVVHPGTGAIKMMVYGDTHVRPTPDAFAACRNVCVWFGGAPVCGIPEFRNDDPLCPLYFELADTELACEYVCARAPFLTRPAFNSKYNSVFYRVHKDLEKNFRIAFDAQLDDKMILTTLLENDGAAPPTAVYAADSFWVCAGKANTCTDAAKLLYFVSQSQTWCNPADDPLGDCRWEMAEHDGAGFYEFGLLGEIDSPSSMGCRVSFAPWPAGEGGKGDCPDGPTSSLQPQSSHYIPGPGHGPILKTKNWDVLWGYGSKFFHVVVLRGFADMKDPTAYPKNPSGTRYVYFLGSGELTYSALAQTGRFYVARVPANEEAIKKGSFQYFTGFDLSGNSLWGAYASARKVGEFDGEPYWPFVPASVIKKNGVYYLAAAAYYDEVGERVFGTWVFQSTDGFAWTPHGLARYSDLVATTPATLEAAARNVYLPFWMPTTLFSDSTRLVYEFSVWNTFGGYFSDFWYDPFMCYEIDPEVRFRPYNTKMYWYQL